MSYSTFPSLFLVLMGSLDCLTTVLGTVFFGTQELNPLISGLVNSNLPVFVIVKLTATVFVGLIFILAEKTLLRAPDKGSKSFKIAEKTLRIAYFSIALFLLVVVLNNVFILLKLFF